MHIVWSWLFLHTLLLKFFKLLAAFVKSYLTHKVQTVVLTESFFCA